MRDFLVYQGGDHVNSTDRPDVVDFWKRDMCFRLQQVADQAVVGIYWQCEMTGETIVRHIGVVPVDQVMAIIEQFEAWMSIEGGAQWQEPTLVQF